MYGGSESRAATGVKSHNRGAVLGRESNSHYHAHKSCLTKADTFSGQKLVIPPDVKVKLDTSKGVSSHLKILM
jgi:hypothetical protein